MSPFFTTSHATSPRVENISQLGHPWPDITLLWGRRGCFPLCPDSCPVCRCPESWEPPACRHSPCEPRDHSNTGGQGVSSCVPRKKRCGEYGAVTVPQITLPFRWVFRLEWAPIMDQAFPHIVSFSPWSVLCFDPAYTEVSELWGQWRKGSLPPLFLQMKVYFSFHVIKYIEKAHCVQNIVIKSMLWQESGKAANLKTVLQRSLQFTWGIKCASIIRGSQAEECWKEWYSVDCISPFSQPFSSHP